MVAVAGVVLVSGCSASSTGGEGNSPTDQVTQGQVEAAYEASATCLQELGYEAIAQRNPSGGWGITFDGELEESQKFDQQYEGCVHDAENLQRAYDRAHVPEGAARVEMANSLRQCLREGGIEGDVYDPANPDSVATLQAIEAILGIDTTGPNASFDDPRFQIALDCLYQHESLFPDRFADP